MKKLFFIIHSVVCMLCALPAIAQLHAHNDYEKPRPFFDAYQHGAGSIEVDIFLKDSSLLVAHDTSQFDKTRTIASLYLNPLDLLIKTSRLRPLQLMIDLKTEAVPTLAALVKILEQYPFITRAKNLKLVISGNRPAPEQFGNYPVYILFDGLLNLQYSADQLERIPMFSDNYKNYADTLQLMNAIKKAHQLGKTIRFWNAPDNPDAWQQLKRLNADWINTDHVKECSAFMHKLNSRDSARDNLSD